MSEDNYTFDPDSVITYEKPITMLRINQNGIVSSEKTKKSYSNKITINEKLIEYFQEIVDKRLNNNQKQINILVEELVKKEYQNYIEKEKEEIFERVDDIRTEIKQIKETVENFDQKENNLISLIDQKIDDKIKNFKKRLDENLLRIDEKIQMVENNMDDYGIKFENFKKEMIEEFKNKYDSNYKLLAKQIEEVKSLLTEREIRKNEINISYEEGTYIVEGLLIANNNKFQFVLRKEDDHVIEEDILINIYDPIKRITKGKIKKIEDISDNINIDYLESELSKVYECVLNEKFDKDVKISFVIKTMFSSI
jgi:hypothetical protein